MGTVLGVRVGRGVGVRVAVAVGVGEGGSGSGVPPIMTVAPGVVPKMVRTWVVGSSWATMMMPWELGVACGGAVVDAALGAASVEGAVVASGVFSVVGMVGADVAGGVAVGVVQPITKKSRALVPNRTRCEYKRLIKTSKDGTVRESAESNGIILA